MTAGALIFLEIHRRLTVPLQVGRGGIREGAALALLDGCRRGSPLCLAPLSAQPRDDCRAVQHEDLALLLTLTADRLAETAVAAESRVNVTKGADEAGPSRSWRSSESSSRISMSRPRACANGSTVWMQRRAGLESSRVTSYSTSSSTNSSAWRRPRSSSGRRWSSPSHS